MNKRGRSVDISVDSEKSRHLAQSANTKICGRTPFSTGVVVAWRYSRF